MLGARKKDVACSFVEGGTVTTAQRVRDYAIKIFVMPAREAGEKLVRISARRLHDGLRLANSYPNVCQAMENPMFAEQAKVALVERTEPSPSSTTEWVFELLSHDSPVQKDDRHGVCAVSCPAAYAQAQHAMAELKAAVYALLANGPVEGLRNADIGRSLGIYTGHVEHEGHIPRTLLAMMEQEGVVVQDEQTKRWSLRNQTSEL